MTEAKKPRIEKEKVNLPDYMDKSFFQDIIRKDEEDDELEVMKYELLPGTELGYHFTSNILKVDVLCKSFGNERTRTLIVKMKPAEDGLKKEYLQEMPMFDREIEIYTKVFPQMVEIMMQVGDMNDQAPRFLYHNEDRSTLVLEDITKQGYELHKEILGFNDFLKVVEHLARFHAQSYYIQDNQYDHPVDLTKYPCMTTENVMKKMKILYDGFDVLKEEVKTWPGYEKYSDKIASLKDKFPSELLKIYQPHPGSLNVLCHGDFTLNNLMFIKENGEIHDTIFLDFQLCFWASPAIDLFSALYAIGNAECLKRREEILMNYQIAFSEYLHLYQSIKNPPTLLELNIEMLRAGILEILWVVCFLPFYYVKFSEKDFEKMFNASSEEVNNVRRTMYRNEAVIEMIKEVLPDLLHRGILT